MLVLILMYFATVLLPQFRATGEALSSGIATIIIICLGISLLGGYGIARNFAGAIASGTANVAIVIIRAFFSGIATFLEWFFRLIPRVYTSVRNGLERNGSSHAFASFIGVIAAVIVVAVII